MLALPSVFVSGSYKYGWTPGSSFPSLSLLEILLLSEGSVPPDSLNSSTEFFGHVFHVLLLAFRRVILPCFWLKMHLCVHDNAKPALYRDGDNSTLIIIRLLPEVWHQTIPPSSVRSYRNSLPVCTVYVTNIFFLGGGGNFLLLHKQLIIHST